MDFLLHEAIQMHFIAGSCPVIEESARSRVAASAAFQVINPCIACIQIAILSVASQLLTIARLFPMRFKLCLASALAVFCCAIRLLER